VALTVARVMTTSEDEEEEEEEKGGDMKGERDERYRSYRTNQLLMYLNAM